MSSEQKLEKQGRLIVFTAPSGAGKTTIVRFLLRELKKLAFSVSATSRPRRDHEVEGRDYYFISAETFRKLIEKDAFLEWEEVYENQYYGTLKSEVDKLLQQGKYVIFDIDVKGALNIKKEYGPAALTIFVKPPSREALVKRLQERNTETPESLKKRISKASRELSYENKFDTVILNDDLDSTLIEAKELVRNFINEQTHNRHHGNPNHPRHTDQR